MEELRVAIFDQRIAGNGAGKAGPAGAGFEFVVESEQRLAGHDVDVDTRLFVVPVFILEGTLGRCLLGHIELQRREPRT